MSLSEDLFALVVNWDACDDYPSHLVDYILTMKIGDLCPDCYGDGIYTLPEWEGKEAQCEHDRAPTLKKLYTIGHVVMQTQILQTSELSDWAQGYLMALKNLQNIKE